MLMGTLRDVLLVALSFLLFIWFTEFVLSWWGARQRADSPEGN